MDVAVRILLSLLITAAVLGGVTAVVSALVRRSRSGAARQGSRPDVLFVVSSRPWQSLLLRSVGLLFVATGVVLVLLAVVLGGSAEGGAIPGVVIALAGLFFVWMAHGVMRARLEVASDSVWVFRWRRAPREIPLNEVSRLEALTGSNYGGVTARSHHHRLFSANRLMLGYPQLIDYLGTRRPDLPIPDASRPL